MIDADQILQRHSRSFALATRLLPKPVATDVKMLYAWCRTCDHVVDDEPSRGEAERRLQLIRDDVVRIYAGEAPQLPESQWLEALVNRYDFPRRWPDDFLAGMASDLDFSPKGSVAELEHYGYQVAGVVGLMLSRILGASDPRACAPAISLGTAMQLTNIARDVSEDWERGRFYLPLEWMPGRVPPQGALPEEEIRRAVQRLLQLADRHYELGRQGLGYLPDAVRGSIRVAADVYQEIGQVIRRADCRVLGRRHYVSTGGKLRRLGLACLAEANYRVGRLVGGDRPPATPTSLIGRVPMKRETLFLATFGLSLTCVMATVMFALVGINPKLESYQWLPWAYAGASAGMAVILGWLARRLDQTPAMAAVPTASGADKPASRQ